MHICGGPVLNRSCVVQVGQYIGELCRYLYAQPEKEEDKKHSVRLMWGNGMRPNMYGDFGRRFAINDIVEVYGTSEGNAQVGNALVSL